MSLTSSLFSAVSGLNSQGNVLGVIGDNIANISTVGFKAGEATFSSLVTGDANAGGAGSGAKSFSRLSIDQQGLIQSTGRSTDIAISGQGFFVVRDNPDITVGEIFFTRAGSFRQDNQGNFVNAAGFALQAYQLDQNGEIIGDKTEPDSLVTVNTRSISTQPTATTQISLGLNLDSEEEALLGAEDTAQPAGTINSGVAASDVLAIDTNITAGDALTIVTTDGTTPSTFTYTYGGFARSDNVTTTIFGVATATATFVEVNNPGNVDHLQDGDQFTITVSGETSTFTFNPTSANAELGTFNNLTNLAAAIDAVDGLSARVADNRLYVAPDDATLAMTFADLGSAEIVSSLGAGMANTSAVADRFASLQGLANLINQGTTSSEELLATIESSANDATLTFNARSPLKTLDFTDAGSGSGNLLTEFGLQTGVIAKVYDPEGTAGSNMASGDIEPHFSRNIRIFDTLGEAHDVRVSFVKAADNLWLVEVYAANEDEVSVSSPLANGQIATGTIEFNTDGTLKSPDTSLTTAIKPIIWTNGASSSNIEIDFGDEDDTNGLSQFSGPYTVQFADQNGSGSGLLSSIEISDEGLIIANFTNGESKAFFQISLATFANPNGLTPKAGNAYSTSDASGVPNLGETNDNGSGVLSVGALEQANTELADELTKLIVAQRAFQANTKIITTADELLDDLNRI